MAGRHLKELFRAFRTNNELAFRRAALEIIEEEQAKHHTALARDLRSLLAVGSNPSVDTSAFTVLPEPPTDRDGDWPLAQVRRPEYSLADLVIHPAVSELLDGLIAETRRWSDIDRHGLPRRQRILFQGPPGCGKTSAAEAVASELGRCDQDAWAMVLVDHLQEGRDHSLHLAVLRSVNAAARRCWGTKR